MNNLIILLSLGIASVIFLVIIRKKGNKSEVLSFLSTMIATLFGVLLAITLSNSASHKKEISDTIKLLKSANNIIHGTYDYTTGLEKYINKLEKDSIHYNDSLLLVLKEHNPIPYPYLMETIISNELIAKNLSEFSHNQIYNSLINLRKVSNYKTIGTYKRFLKETSLLIELEVQYQEGDLDLETLIDKYNSGSKELAIKYPPLDKSEINIEEN